MQYYVKATLIPKALTFTLQDIVGDVALTAWPNTYVWVSVLTTVKHAICSLKNGIGTCHSPSNLASTSGHKLLAVDAPNSLNILY